ncbi:hypothetical protein J4225_03585 [Candidatus Pacearchaeota archaeon]|nr:hypothetical protein [Candidatus Pacearchaeota archaeon]
MPIKSQENTLGAWAFLIGVILAVIIGLFSSTFIQPDVKTIYSPAIYAILVILGIIVGFVGVTGKDAHTFLVSGTVIVLVGWLGKEGAYGSLIGIGIQDIVSSTFGALLALFAPATIIVALKTVFNISKV